MKTKTLKWVIACLILSYLIIVIAVIGIGLYYKSIRDLCNRIQNKQEISTSVGNAYCAPRIFSLPGALIAQAGDASKSPLATACRYGNVQAAEVLLKNGANPNDWSMREYALAVAATGCGTLPEKVAIVRLLLEYGADVGKYNYTPIVLELLQRMSDLGAKLSSTDQQNAKSLIFDLLDMQDSDEFKEKYYGQILPYAVQTNDVPFVLELIDRYHLDVRSESKGESLLYWMVYNPYSNEERSLSMVNMLLEQGVDPLIQNEDGESALSIAKEHQFFKIVDLIYKYGYLDGGI